VGVIERGEGVGIPGAGGKNGWLDCHWG
jgi:hypothetical protein